MVFLRKQHNIALKCAAPWNNHNRLCWSHTHVFVCLCVYGLVGSIKRPHFFVFLVHRSTVFTWNDNQNDGPSELPSGEWTKTSTNKCMDKLCPIIINYVGARNSTFLPSQLCILHDFYCHKLTTHYCCYLLVCAGIFHLTVVTFFEFEIGMNKQYWV